MHHHEVALELLGVARRDRELSEARPTVHVEQHRLGAIVAAHQDRLLGPAERHALERRDRVRGVDGRRGRRQQRPETERERDHEQ
jgi:hypothetical protein